MKYPVWRIYLLDGDTLKYPYGLSTPTEKGNRLEALQAAISCSLLNRSRYDVVVLRFDEPGVSTIEHYISREEW